MRLFLLFYFLLISAAFGVTQQQTLNLTPGWNAIWLEVEPRAADGTPAGPEVVFAAVPQVRTVARFLAARGHFQFITDPTAESLGDDFWLKWRRDTVVGGNTLGGIAGNAAYLIFNAADTPVSFVITGEARYHRYEWTPDSYHFVGVPVGDTAPTFSEFFTASGAHPLNQIYKLVAGKWVAVQANERFQKNAAYWVYARGGSAYQGPVPVLFTNAGGYLEFGESLEFSDFSAGNLNSTPATLSLQRLVDNGLTLRDATSGSGIVDFAITADGTGAGTIAPSTTAAIRLEARRPWLTAPAARENLYRMKATLSSGSSYYQYLPVRASRDLAAVASASDPLPGLWVGDVVLTQATSLVAGKTDSGTLAGPRLEPVKRPLHYRVILHVNAGGQAQLLEHATLMKKVRASEDLPEEFVVVVDDTKIPNFVGIEKRGGKLVGKRFDTAAYDLPRSVLPSIQDEANPDFVPSTLSQEYRLSLALQGNLSPGGVITTAANSFVLDAWHRTHPFRHVFNPEHRKGFRITREMRFEVDATGSPEAAGTSGFGTSTLSGIFKESLTGLMKPGDVHQSRGRFILQRISEVTELQ